MFSCCKHIKFKFDHNWSLPIVFKGLIHGNVLRFSVFAEPWHNCLYNLFYYHFKICSPCFKIFDIKVSVSGLSTPYFGRLRGLTGSALDHRSLPPEFEPRRGHIWRVFHLRLRFVTFRGSSGHLAYYVHKSGRKTSITIIIIIHTAFVSGFLASVTQCPHMFISPPAMVAFLKRYGYMVTFVWGHRKNGCWWCVNISISRCLFLLLK